MVANSIGGGVTLLNALNVEQVTFILNETSTTDADIGKPVKLDTTQANSVKLLTEDTVPIGVIVATEDRVTEGVILATVALKGGAFTLAYKTGDAVAIGEAVVGSDTGVKVKRVASPTALNRTQVVSKNATDETVDVIFY